MCPRLAWRAHRDRQAEFSLTIHGLKEAWPSRDRLDGAQIVRGRLAGPAVRNDVERDLLPLVEGAHASAFDGTDMHEDVLAAAFLLDKAESLLAVKPLHSSSVHRCYFSNGSNGVMCGRWRTKIRGHCPGSSMFGEVSET